MNRAVLFLLLLLAGTTATQPSRILIAYESTAFKKDLVDEMLVLLKKDAGLKRCGDRWRPISVPAVSLRRMSTLKIFPNS